MVYARRALSKKIGETERILLIQAANLTWATEKRIDDKLLIHELGLRYGWFYGHLRPSASQWWDRLEEAKRIYLLARAGDIALFGTSLADRTWPPPGFPGLPQEPIAPLVSLLVTLLTEVKKEPVDKDIQDRSNTSYSPERVPLPESLPPRVLSGSEVQQWQRQCIAELEQADGVTRQVATAIDAFVQFCELLAKPENQIKVRTGQYVESRFLHIHDLGYYGNSAGF